MQVYNNSTGGTDSTLLQANKSNL